MKHSFLAVCALAILLLGFLSTDGTITGKAFEGYEWRDKQPRVESAITMSSDPDAFSIQNMGLTTERFRSGGRSAGTLTGRGSKVNSIVISNTYYRSTTPLRWSALHDLDADRFDINRDGFVNKQDTFLAEQAWLSVGQSRSAGFTYDRFNARARRLGLDYPDAQYFDVNRDGVVDNRDAILTRDALSQHRIPNNLRGKLVERHTCGSPGRIICPGTPLFGPTVSGCYKCVDVTFEPYYADDTYLPAANNRRENSMLGWIPT